MNKYFAFNLNQTTYYSALLFAFTLPLSRAAISFFLILFLVLFFIQSDLKKSWNILKSNPVFKSMGLFFLFICSSLLWSQDTHEALNQIRLYSYWILIPILSLLLKKESLPHFISAFLLGMFVSEIIAYGIFFEFWQFNGKTPNDPSPFMSHIHYSIFLAITAIILLNRIFSNHYTLLEKVPMSIFFLTTTINLFLSGGRTGQVAFLIAIGMAIIIHFRMTLKAALIFILLNSLLFIGAYFTLPTYKDRIHQAINDLQMQDQGVYNTSLGLRNGFWIIASDAFLKDPIIGVGIGDYKLATIQVLKQNNHHFDAEAIEFFKRSDYHNQHLMILIQLGLVGFGLMMWMIINFYRLMIEDEELKNISILTLSIYFVSALSESLWISQFTIITFVFIAIISITLSEQFTISKPKELI